MNPILHWSSYWGTYSRVLIGYNSPDGVVEVNLTPVNFDHDFSWTEQIVPILFRYHGTSLGRKDEWGRFPLPEVWQRVMVDRIGEELTHRLLTEDWLSLIDLAKVKRGRVGGGGISFEEVKR